MNHCLIQAAINGAPQLRYTKDNKTPIAEMTVIFKGLRDEDPSRELKVLGHYCKRNGRGIKRRPKHSS